MNIWLTKLHIAMLRHTRWPDRASTGIESIKLPLTLQEKDSCPSIPESRALVSIAESLVRIVVLPE
jgi:hypothetical protein